MIKNGADKNPLTQLTHQPATLKKQRNFAIVSLSLHFNGHFPGEPGLAGVY